MLIVFFEREDVDRRQFCRCIIGVSGVPRGPYCMCKTKMAACALRIKCCVLESCCSFDGSFPSWSTSKAEFLKLVDELRPFISPNLRSPRPGISAEKKFSHS